MTSLDQRSKVQAKCWRMYIRYLPYLALHSRNIPKLNQLLMEYDIAHLRYGIRILWPSVRSVYDPKLQAQKVTVRAHTYLSAR
jgi:hypothetical protein